MWLCRTCISLYYLDKCVMFAVLYCMVSDWLLLFTYIILYLLSYVFFMYLVFPSILTLILEDILHNVFLFLLYMPDWDFDCQTFTLLSITIVWAGLGHIVVINMKCMLLVLTLWCYPINREPIQVQCTLLCLQIRWLCGCWHKHSYFTTKFHCFANMYTCLSSVYRWVHVEVCELAKLVS